MESYTIDRCDATGKLCLKRTDLIQDLRAEMIKSEEKVPQANKPIKSLLEHLIKEAPTPLIDAYSKRPESQSSSAGVYSQLFKRNKSNIFPDSSKNDGTKEAASIKSFEGLEGYLKDLADKLLNKQKQRLESTLADVFKVQEEYKGKLDKLEKEIDQKAKKEVILQRKIEKLESNLASFESEKHKMLTEFKELKNLVIKLEKSSLETKDKLASLTEKGKTQENLAPADRQVEERNLNYAEEEQKTNEESSNLKHEHTTYVDQSNEKNQNDSFLRLPHPINNSCDENLTLSEIKHKDSQSDYRNESIFKSEISHTINSSQIDRQERQTAFLNVSIADSKVNLEDENLKKGQTDYTNTSSQFNEERSTQITIKQDETIRRLDFDEKLEHGDQLVYRTATGAKYHRENCRHLWNSKYETKLKDVLSYSLTPCLICRPPDMNFLTSNTSETHFNSLENNENVSGKTISSEIRDCYENSSKTVEKQEPGNQIVYRTATGKRYHRGSCGYLWASKYETKLKDVHNYYLTPCMVCSPPELSAEFVASLFSEKNEKDGDPKGNIPVYRTNTGGRYHLGTCRHLWNSKIEIKLKEAKYYSLTPCMVCYPPSLD